MRWGLDQRIPTSPMHPKPSKNSAKKLCAEDGFNDIIEFKVGNGGNTFAYTSKANKLIFTPQQLWGAKKEKFPKEEPKTR